MGDDSLKASKARRDAILNNIDKQLKGSKSVIQEAPIFTPGQTKRFTGGVDFSDVQKHLGSNVNILNRDLQQRLGEEQSAWDKWGNFGMQVGAEVIGGTIEGVGYLGDMDGTVRAIDGDMDSFGNWFSDIGIAMKEGSREEFPIFGAHDMGNAGYWLSNGVSVASTLSLMIPAVGTVRGIGMIGRAAGIAAKMGKSTKATMSILGQAVVSRHMENMMEASQTWEITRDTAFQNGASMEEANRVASTAASNLYKVNYALIAQDVFQYSLIAKGAKINKAVTSRKMANAMGQSPLKAVANTAYPYATDMVTEGFEEGFQFIFAEEAQYRALSEAGLIDLEDAGDRVVKYAKNSQLWTNMMFGSLGAGVMQGTAAGLKQTNIPIFGGNKAEQEYLEARIKHANESYTNITAASVKLQAAMNAKDEGGIIEAEAELAFNSAYNAASLGNFDIATANVDKLIEEIKNGENKEEFSPEFESKLESLKEDMATVADLYRKNSNKYAASTVRGITAKQFENLRLSKDLQEKETQSRETKEAFPRYNNLTATGQDKFALMTRIEALKQAKGLSATSALSIGTEEAQKNSELFQEELDGEIKAAETKLEEINAAQQKDLDQEGQGALVGNRANQIKKDNKILDGFLNNADDAITADRNEYLTDRRIDQNNTVLKMLTDTKGQNAIEEQEEAERARIRSEEKDLIQERKNAKKEKRDNAITNSKKKTSDKKKAKEETKSVKPKTKPKRSRLEDLTDAQLNNAAELAESEEALTNIQNEIKRRADERAGITEKNAEKFDKKTSEQADIIAVNSADNAPTPNNTNVIISEAEAEVFNAVSETGYSLAWLSTTKADDLDLEINFSDPEMAKLVTDYLEDVNISLLDHSLEFFIDEEELKNSRTYKQGDTTREISEKLAKGEDIGSLIGMLPVKAYLIGKDGKKVNIENRDLVIPIHDITFEGWNKLDPEKAEAARSELISLKTNILDNKGTNLTSPITEQRGGAPNNTEEFVNAAEALNSTPEDIVLVMGSKALPGTQNGQYVNNKKDPVGDLEHLESARPGALYAATKRPNGETFPIRLWVSKLGEQEAELIHQLYVLTLEDPEAYRSALNRHPGILKFIKNSNDTRVSGILDFVNESKSTIQDLLSLLVYEGSHTKTMGPGTLLSSKAMVKVGSQAFSKEDLNSPEGKVKFKAAMADKIRQIPNELIEDINFKRYLVDNEILTANFEPGKANFVQPTVVFGQETLPVKKKVDAKETITDKDAAPEQLNLLEGEVKENTASNNEVTDLGTRVEVDVKVDDVVKQAEEAGTSMNVTEGIKDKEAIKALKAKLAEKLDKTPVTPPVVETDTYEDNDYEDEALGKYKLRDTTDNSKPLTQAEVQKVAQIVPNSVAIEMVEDYITLLSGGRGAVGLFTSGLVTLSAHAKTGDAFHEAFHAVFSTSLSSNKQRELLNEAKTMFLGPIEQDLNLLMALHSVDKATATDIFYEEQLADEFALYTSNPAGYKVTPQTAKARGLFARILEWIKSILQKPKNYKSLFEDILNGDYRSADNVDAYIASGTVASINNKTKKPC